MEKRFLLICFVFLLNSQVFCQDSHFSQFYNNLMLLNPALAGNKDKDYRITAQYRKQYLPNLPTASYNTTAVAVEGGFYKANDFWGFGLNVLSDKAGTGDVAHQQADMAIAYTKRLSGANDLMKQYLTAGASMGLGRYAVNYEALQWVEQFSGGEFQRSLPPTLSLNDLRPKNIIDAGVGIVWRGENQTGIKKNFLVSLSAHHLTKPNMSLIKGAYTPLDRRWTLYAKADWTVRRSIKLQPQLLYIQQGKRIDVMFGSHTVWMSKNIDLIWGNWIRLAKKSDKGLLTDAYISSIGVDLKEGGMITMSYDFSLSALTKNINVHNAVELTYVYRIKK